MNPESSSTASFDTSLFVVASIGVKHPVFITATSSHAMPLNDDMHGNDASRSVNDDGDAITFCFDDESDNGDNNEAATNCCDNEFGDDANSFSIDDDNNAEDDVTPATPTFCNDGVDDNDEDVSDKSDDEVFKGKTICCEDKVCSNGGDDPVSDNSDDDDCGDLSTREDTFGCEDEVGGVCCKDDDDECTTAFSEDDVINDCGNNDHNDGAATARST
jgi:hypothetical protein